MKQNQDKRFPVAAMFIVAIFSGLCSYFLIGLLTSAPAHDFIQLDKVPQKQTQYYISPAKGGLSSLVRSAPVKKGWGPNAKNGADYATKIAISDVIEDTYPEWVDLHYTAEELMIMKARCEANNIADWLLPVVVAIGIHENGGAEQLPDGTYGPPCPAKRFGVKHPKAWNTNFTTQVGWCAATVAKNWDRYVTKYGNTHMNGFIEFLGKKYAPPGAENDPDNLNQHWIAEVQRYVSLWPTLQ